MGRIAGIVDGGATGVGVESTVIDCSVDVPVILRPGGVTFEQLQSVIGTVRQDAALKNKDAAPKAPGMKYTHYAPQSPLYLVKGSPEFLQSLVNDKKGEGLKVGVITSAEHREEYDADFVIAPGSLSDLATVAAGLYDTLRKFDEWQPDIIFSEVFPEKGIGVAIMNRLTKAAGHRVIEQSR